MVFVSGGKKHNINVDAVKKMTYKELEQAFKGKLDYARLEKELGIKKTRKQATEKEQ